MTGVVLSDVYLHLHSSGVIRTLSLTSILYYPSLGDMPGAAKRPLTYAGAVRSVESRSSRVFRSTKNA